ncbi:retrovirus-related pol polyprotein from transposon TNT 1-94 [Tanacetum coccineum]
MEAGSSTMVTAIKLPVLNPGEFELWKIRIEQYFLMTDYALWEVIVNGDSPLPKRTVDGVEKTYPPTNEMRRSSSSNQNSQNMAFVSSNNPGSSNQAYGSNSANTDSISDAVIYSFFANQSNSLQLNDEDLQQIDADDLQEMDLKWQMAMVILQGSAGLKERTGTKNLLKKDITTCTYGYTSSSFFKLRLTRNKRYKTSKEYHAVPPPYTGNFMPPKYDLILADEGEYVFSESVTSIPDAATSEAKTSVSKPKSVGEPLIEDWISDSEDENETEFKSKQRKPSFAKTKFVKSNEHVKTPRESVKKIENKKQAKYPRKNSQSPRDCDLYEKKMVEKTIWNNARRANHQNSQRMTHPHPKGNFVPKAVLMKSGIKSLNTAGQNFSKAAGDVTTAGPKAVVSNNKGNEANAVKASACWVWRPKQKVLDHVFRHNENKYLPSDYEEINGGFIAFGGDPKGGRITGKADSKLPTTFWAEAVNTACYAQNRVLVIKPHNKTPYELFLGRKPALSFMRPFRYPVTILNTLNHLGKFDGKADEGFFVGYSTNSKAYKVFKSRTRIVEENMHVKFSEETPNFAGNGPNWLFDIDALTISMNYKPVVTGNQTNGNAGTKENIDAGQDGKKIVPDQKYILLPLLTSDPSLSKSSKDSPDAEFKPSREEEKINSEHQENEDSEVPNTEEPRVNQEQDANVNNTNNIYTVSLTVSAADIENNVVDKNIVYGCIDDLNMPNLEEIFYSDDDEEVGAEADMRKNLTTRVLRIIH